MVQLVAGIDWITATCKIDGERYVETVEDARIVAHGALINLDIPDFMRLKWTPAQTQRFYKYSFDIDTFGRIDVAEDAEKQGVRLVVSSKSIQRNLQSPHTLIWNLEDEGWKITRIDVAFDIFNSGIKPSDVLQAWRAKGVAAASRSYSFVVGNRGSTFGVGSRQSPIYGRCYDKGAEQATSKDWLRLELELKYDAPAQFLPMLRHDAGCMWAEMVRRFGLDGTQLGDFIKEECGAGEVPLYKRHRAKTNTEKWLYEQVLPARKKMERTDEGAALRFFETLAVWLSGGDDDTD